MRQFSYYCGLLILLCGNAVALSSGQSTTSLSNQRHLAALYLQAESYINSRPLESMMSVAMVKESYQYLQSRWVGEPNAGYNQIQIAINPLFAKTTIFNTPTAAESSEFIKFSRFKYTTPSPDGIQKVSGLLLVPQFGKPRGIVLFFHSTIAGKLNAPSLHFNDYKSIMLAAIFAANGYIVVAPDYIGLGDNFKAVHPYILYPEINVGDGKNMLVAVMDDLRRKHQLQNVESLPLFVSGYSEGASYALWFSRIYQEQKKFRDELSRVGLQLKKTVPIEGAYNLTGVMFPFLLTNQVNDSQNRFNINTAFWGVLLKPELLANVMVSYSYYNKVPIDQLLNRQFYSLQCSIIPDSNCSVEEWENLDLNSLTLTPLKTFPLVLKYFGAALFKNNQGIIYNPLFNSVMPLMVSGAASNSKLLAQANKANIVNWYSKYPITLISLMQDSVVPEQNSTDAFNGMLESKSQNLSYLKIDNNLLKARAILGPAVSDHVSFELYALLIALKEFNN